LELIFTMLGEKSTSEITKTKDDKGLEQCTKSAREGGEIAGNARKALEKKTGKKVVSSNNQLALTKRKKLNQTA